MNKTTVKRIFCAILCAAIALSLAACGAKTTKTDGVDLREKLASLMVTDEKLGIAGKYVKLSDVEGGSIDADLVGTWITADGETTYSYSADGTAKATSVYGDNEAPFTCITIGDYKIICEEVELSPEFYDGAQPGDTQLSYTAYSVENDALYQVIVEEVNEDYTSNMSALVTLYRADETGSAAASIEKNPIDMSALNGTWADDEKGSFTIEDGVLTLGADNYNVSFDEKNQLVVEKDGQSTAYHMAVSMMKEYDYEDRTQFTTSTMMGVSYTGADENDVPNLLSVLTDYKTEFEYDSWYYSGSFKLSDGSEAEDDGDDMSFDNLFGKGVWSASIDGEIDTYFVFYDETSGRTERADGTGGVGFTCEQNGWDVVFHFGSDDDVTNATFSEGDLTGTFDYGDRTVVYTFEFVADADADTFEVPAN